MKKFLHFLKNFFREIHPNFYQKMKNLEKFGMKNFKKLSDFLKDEKFNLYQKSDVLLVESDDEIVWIVGIRADNRFRITENTKKVLILEKI